MERREILKKAVQKALDSGWNMLNLRSITQDDSTPPWYIVSAGQMPTPQVVEDWVSDDSLMVCGYGNYYTPWESFIFDQDFAKALWGEYGAVPEAVYRFNYKKTSGVERTLRYTVVSQVSPWQYHLQQMVIADDPIAYLGENI